MPGGNPASCHAATPFPSRRATFALFLSPRAVKRGKQVRNRGRKCRPGGQGRRLLRLNIRLVRKYDGGDSSVQNRGAGSAEDRRASTPRSWEQSIAQGR